MSKSKKKRRFSTKFFITAIILLVVFLAIGIHQNSSNPLTKIVFDYIMYKQEITDILGDISDIQGLPTTSWDASKKNQEIIVSLKGSQASGSLLIAAEQTQEEWQLSAILLKVGEKIHKLSPLYVDKISYYEASESSQPLSKPVFEAGKDIYIKTLLKGVLKQQSNVHITQSLGVFDKKNNLVASKKYFSSYRRTKESSKPTQKKEDLVNFVTKISNLIPGEYYVELIFTDQHSGLKETHLRKIKITKTNQDVRVRSVRYFEDKNKQRGKKGTEFTANKDIYLRMHLDGFLVNNTNISGSISLKVENSKGELVAYKPQFASFNQRHDPQKDVFIDGHMILKEPDIYFLSFRIRDYFAGNYITHDEKIVVQLQQFEEEL